MSSKWLRWTKGDTKLAWYEHLWAGLPMALMIVGGAIGGACGGAAWAINERLIRGKGSKSKRYALTAAVSLASVAIYLLIAGVFVSVTGIGDDSAKRVDQELEKSPLYAVIQKADPGTYERIRAAMVEGRKRKQAQPEIDAAVQSYLAELTKKYLPIASDEAIIKTTQVLTLEIDQIGAKSADACFDFLFPRPDSQPVAILRYITPEVAQLETDATGAVIESGSVNPQRIPSNEEIAPTLQRAVGQLIEKYGVAEVAALNNPGTLDHGRACALVGDLYKGVLALPPREGAPLLRFLFAQGPRA